MTHSYTLAKDLVVSTLVILLLILSLTSNAQSWFEGTPNWYYDYSTWNCLGETGGYDQILYSRDTVIDDITMHIFTVKKYRNTLGDEEWNERSVIYHESGGQIYEYMNERDGSKLLYNFNYEIGDSLDIHVHVIGGELSEYFCDTLVTYVLDTIEITTQYSETPLQVQQWKLVQGRSDKESFTVVEKIGAVGEYFFDMNFLNICGLDICPVYTYNCYYNPEIIGNDLTQECRGLLSSTTADLQGRSVNIYPSPAQSDINISSDLSLESALIFTSNGTLVQTIDIRHDQHSISIHQLSSGIYYIVFNDHKGKSFTDRFIKH